MTIEADKQIAGRFLHAWNAGAENSVDGLAHPDFEVQYIYFREPVQGIKRFKDKLCQTHQSFPDLKIEVEDMVAEGERMWCGGPMRVRTSRMRCLALSQPVNECVCPK